ncbi:MAG: hypothetical protein ACK4M2_01560 [Brevundimonas sp.]
MVIEPNIRAFQNADILDALDESPNGQISGIKELAKQLGRDDSNLGKTLRGMVSEGLLQDPPLAGLTDEGRAQLAAFKRAQHGGERKRPRGQWPLDKFRPNPLNRPVRREVLPEMAASMRGPAGLVQRVKTTEPDANGVRMLIDGEHRWEAAKLVAAQIAEEAGVIPDWLADGLPFEEGAADPATALIITLVANARRADMSPWEDAQQLLKLQQATEWTASELARQIGRVSEGERTGLRDVQQKLKIAREATPDAVAEYETTGSWDTLRASVSTPKVATPEIITTKAQRLALAELFHKAGHTLSNVAILPSGHTAEGARLAQYGLAILTRSDKGDTARVTQNGLDYLKAEGLAGGIEYARQKLGFPEGYGVAKLRTEWLNTPQDDDPWHGRGWTHVQTHSAPVANIPAVLDASLALFKQTDGSGDTRYRVRFRAERMDRRFFVNQPIPGPSSAALAYQMAIEDMLKYEWPEAPQELIEWGDRIAGPFVVAGRDHHNASRAQEARYALGWDRRQSNSGGGSTSRSPENGAITEEEAAETTAAAATVAIEDEGDVAEMISNIETARIEPLPPGDEIMLTGPSGTVPAHVMRDHLSALAQGSEHPTNAALRLISEERRRQVEVERFTPAQDDEQNEDGELALAAAAYASAYTGDPDAGLFWPGGWNPHMFKPSQDARDLVRAGALIVAELERRARVLADTAGNA